MRLMDEFERQAIQADHIEYNTDEAGVRWATSIDRNGLVITAWPVNPTTGACIGAYH
jgi:hypothetical protein